MKYEKDLPPQENEVFISDGGLETVLVYRGGWDLPENAAFVLLESSRGREALREYFSAYRSIAREYNLGFILESPTWRASADWLQKVGYPQSSVVDINREAVKLLQDIQDGAETGGGRIVISGCLGPRGDGYVVHDKMSPESAEDYHSAQIRALSDAEVNLVSAFTINYVEEAIGIIRAAKSVQVPAVISFTVEADGKLPSGESLEEAISRSDDATQSYCEYYMINCSHPTHIEKALVAGKSWLGRIRGIRGNASAKSHEELDTLTELDAGNPVEFGNQYVKLKSLLPNLSVMGGCCGTDHRHIREICRALYTN